MILTATFNDYNPVPIQPKRKNGIIKYDWQTIEVLDTLHPVTVKHHNGLYNFYIRGKDLDNKNRFPALYHADGSVACGIWRHGRTGGKAHEERLEYSAELGKLIEVTNYQNGRVKDSKKYLISIIDPCTRH